MIVGLGNDILEIARIKKAVLKKDFLKRYFTELEIDLFESKKMNPSTIAANFSAKEAVSKVFGIGVRGFGLKEIEILRDDMGKPYINLYNKAKEISDSIGIIKLHITISHSRELVNVIVIGESQN